MTGDVGADGGPGTAPDSLVVELTRYRSWDDLVARWTKVVDAIVTGYQFSIYDYRNDLDSRSIVEDVLLAARKRGLDAPSGVAGRLAEADARFMAATRPTTTQLATRNLGPWASRVPIAPGEELARDIAVEHSSRGGPE